MKRFGVFALIIAVFLASSAAAALNQSESSKISSAYTCLENSIANKTSSSLSLQEAIFSTLALGNNAHSVAKLDAEKQDSDNKLCWPKGSCNLKETSQALLAYDVLGRNTESIESYLLSKQGSATGMQWFLEIDIPSQEQSQCSIKYDGSEYTATINPDMTISGSLGSCLTTTSEGYWLEISQTCIEKTFEISCDKDFITSLLFKKTNSETIYVLPSTQSTPSSGTVQESVNVRCLKNGDECDFEGTLWGALALDSAGRDISSYLPYLITSSEDNSKYFPEAFLYKLSLGAEYYSSLIQAQRQGHYWEAIGSPNGKFYDTALALLALQSSSAVEVGNAKNYLLTVQGTNGCWDNSNVRSTAFILYSGWPDATRQLSSGPSTQIESCLAASPSYSCVSSVFDCTNAGGQKLDNYDCPGSGFCCSVAPQISSCSALGGSVCTSSESCSGTLVPSQESPRCCLSGICQQEITQDDDCTISGGICRDTCDSSEEPNSEFCSDSSQVCCIESESSSGPKWGLITLLIILIILAALAIIFRNKLKLMLFKARRSDVSSSPIMKRPSFPPSGPPMPRPAPTIHSQKAKSKIDSEMEDTLRKLKEMTG